MCLHSPPAGSGEGHTGGADDAPTPLRPPACPTRWGTGPRPGPRGRLRPAPAGLGLRLGSWPGLRPALPARPARWARGSAPAPAAGAPPPAPPGGLHLCVVRRGGVRGPRTPGLAPGPWPEAPPGPSPACPPDSVGRCDASGCRGRSPRGGRGGALRRDLVPHRVGTVGGQARAEPPPRRSVHSPRRAEGRRSAQGCRGRSPRAGIGAKPPIPNESGGRVGNGWGGAPPGPGRRPESAGAGAEPRPWVRAELRGGPRSSPGRAGGDAPVPGCRGGAEVPESAVGPTRPLARPSGL